MRPLEETEGSRAVPEAQRDHGPEVVDPRMLGVGSGQGLDQAPLIHPGFEVGDVRRLPVLGERGAHPSPYEQSDERVRIDRRPAARPLLPLQDQGSEVADQLRRKAMVTGQVVQQMVPVVLGHGGPRLRRPPPLPVPARPDRQLRAGRSAAGSERGSSDR